MKYAVIFQGAIRIQRYLHQRFARSSHSQIILDESGTPIQLADKGIEIHLETEWFDGFSIGSRLTCRFIFTFVLWILT